MPKSAKEHTIITVTIDVDAMPEGITDACWALRETARLLLEKAGSLRSKGRELAPFDSFGEEPFYSCNVEWREQPEWIDDAH